MSVIWKNGLRVRGILVTGELRCIYLGRLIDFVSFYQGIVNLDLNITRGYFALFFLIGVNRSRSRFPGRT